MNVTLCKGNGGTGGVLTRGSEREVVAYWFYWTILSCDSKPIISFVNFRPLVEIKHTYYALSTVKRASSVLGLLLCFSVERMNKQTC